MYTHVEAHSCAPNKSSIMLHFSCCNSFISRDTLMYRILHEGTVCRCGYGIQVWAHAVTRGSAQAACGCMCGSCEVTQVCTAQSRHHGDSAYTGQCVPLEASRLTHHDGTSVFVVFTNCISQPSWLEQRCIGTNACSWDNKRHAITGQIQTADKCAAPDGPVGRRA